MLYPEKNLFLSTTKCKTEIYEILVHLKSLKYEDRPDYELIYSRIREMQSKELTRIFHQRYSNNIMQENIFFDLMKNNSNKLYFGNSHNGNQNLFRHAIDNFYDNSNNYANANCQQKNYNISYNYDNNHYNYANEHNNLSNFLRNVSVNPKNANFCSNLSLENPMQNMNSAYINSGYKSETNNNFNFNNGLNINRDNFPENAYIENNPNNLQYNSINKKCSINNPNKSINNNFTNENIIKINSTNNNNYQRINLTNNIDFGNLGNINENNNNPNYANLDVLKNLYLDQIELESNKRMKKEELFNLNNLKNNLLQQNSKNNHCLNNDKNINYNNKIYYNDSNVNNKLVNVNHITNKTEPNINKNTSQFINPAAVINIKDINYDNNKSNKFISNNFNNANNSQVELFINNDNCREIITPDSDLLLSNKSKTNNRSIIENNYPERVESNNENNEDNLSNISNCLNDFNYNNNELTDNNKIEDNIYINKVNSLVLGDGVFASNDVISNSNFANLNGNSKDMLTNKKRNRVNSSDNKEGKNNSLENSKASEYVEKYNQNNIKSGNKINFNNNKIIPISKSDFSSENSNKKSNKQVFSQEKLDSPLLECSPLNSEMNKNEMNFNNLSNNNPLSPKITNNNTNLSNNNQNQIFIINQFSKNNNLTELEKDLINYFINYEAKNISSAPVSNSTNINNNSNNYYINNKNYKNNFCSTNPNASNLNNINPINYNNNLDQNNVDKLLSKLVKENLLKQYIETSMQNIFGNGMNDNNNNNNSNNYNNIGDINNKYGSIFNQNNHSNKPNLFHGVDLLKNRNFNNNISCQKDINYAFGLIDKNISNKNVLNQSSFLNDSPISQIFHKILEQSSYKGINQNTNNNNQNLNFNQNKDPQNKMSSNNSNNANIKNNFDDLLNLNLPNLFGNNSSSNKYENELKSINNNLTDFQNLLNQNFIQSHQSCDPLINLGLPYNKNIKLQNADNNSVFPIKRNSPSNANINNVNSHIKEPLSVRNRIDQLDLENQNNFLSSLLNNEENLNLKQYKNKDNLYANDFANANLSNISNTSCGNYNNNYPSHLNFNLNLNESNNLSLNNFNSKMYCDNQLLLLKQEMESRKNLLNGNFFKNNTNTDPNYALIYNLLSQDNINNARNLFNN